MLGILYPGGGGGKKSKVGGGNTIYISTMSMVKTDKQTDPQSYLLLSNVEDFSRVDLHVFPDSVHLKVHLG